MRKVFSILPVILLAASAAAQQPFKPYTSPDEKFTISFPGTPHASAPNEQKTSDGTRFVEQHYSVADDAAYILLVADYPFATNEAGLQRVAKEQAASCGAAPANILSDKTLQGRPALLFAVDCPNAPNRRAISLMVQAVADGNRLYRVMYGTSEKSNADRVESFLLSFRINK